MESSMAFFTYGQNNMNATLVRDREKGVAEYVIIEATSAAGANKKARSLGIDFSEECECCGPRWIKARSVEADSYPDPRVYGRYVFGQAELCGAQEARIFIHYIDDAVAALRWSY